MMTFLGTFETKSGKDSSARRGVGKNNGEYSVWLPQGVSGEDSPTFVRETGSRCGLAGIIRHLFQKKIGQDFLLPFPDKEWEDSP